MILMEHVKDPGLSGGNVTITGAAVTPDLREAKVFWSVYGDADAKKEAARGLRRCGGFIRRELGKVLDLRHTPELFFHFDDSYEKGMKMERLLHEISQTPETPPGENTEESSSTDQGDEGGE